MAINSGLLSSIKTGAQRVGSALKYTAGKVINANVPAIPALKAMNQPGTFSGIPKQTLTAPQQTLSNNLVTGGGLLGQAVGFKATSPDANVKPPTTTLPQSQTVPNTLLTSPTSVFKQTPQTSTGGGTSTSTTNASSTSKLPGESDQAYGARMQQQYAAADAARSGASSGAGTGAGGGVGAGTPSTVAPSGSIPPVGGGSVPNTGAGASYPGGLYGQLIGGLAASSLGINPMAQQGMDAYQKSVQDLANFRQNIAKQTAGIESTPMELEYQQGQKAILGREAASREQALQGAIEQQQAGIGYGQAQQGLMQSGLGAAAGFAAPMQFGLTMDPVTGQPINMSAMQVPLQTAMRLYQARTPLSDPAYAQALGPMGSAGWMMFYNQLQGGGAGGMGGGFNPAAQSAAAGQDIAYGSQTQGAAQGLNLALQNLRMVSPMITNMMSSAGIGSTGSPLYNQPINTYIGNLKSPGAMTSYNALVNALQSYSSGIMSTGGNLTPSEVSAATALQNPANLSIADMKYYLDVIDREGSNRLNILQRESSTGYGGYSGYSGTPSGYNTGVGAAPVVSSNTPGAGIDNPVGQALAGTGLDIFGGLKQIGSSILGYIVGDRKSVV